MFQKTYPSNRSLEDFQVITNWNMFTVNCFTGISYPMYCLKNSSNIKLSSEEMKQSG